MSLYAILGSTALGGALSAISQDKENEAIDAYIRNLQDTLIDEDEEESMVRRQARGFNASTAESMDKYATGSRNVLNPEVLQAIAIGKGAAMQNQAESQLRLGIDERNSRIDQMIAQAKSQQQDPFTAGVSGAFAGAQTGISLSKILAEEEAMNSITSFLEDKEE